MQKTALVPHKRQKENESEKKTTNTSVGIRLSRFYSASVIRLIRIEWRLIRNDEVYDEEIES